jgi:hypothetical protein
MSARTSAAASKDSPAPALGRRAARLPQYSCLPDWQGGRTARARSATGFHGSKAALKLNGFNDTDIAMLVGQMSPSDRESVRNAAVTAMPGWSQRVVDPIEALAHEENEKARIAQLNADYDAAVREGRWEDAALHLNGFNDTDIEARTAKLDPDQLDKLTSAAQRKMPGWSDRVVVPAQMSLLNQVPLLFPSGGGGRPVNPLVDWNAGNLRGLGAEDTVLFKYPGALKMPAKFPGVDYIQGGTATPMTGLGPKGLPFSQGSATIEDGTLIQYKTMKNSLPYYQEPKAVYKDLSKGMEKLEIFDPGTGRSEKIGSEWFRVEHTAPAERRVLHIELEVAPTPAQQAQLARLAAEGEGFGAFGAGNKVEVVVSAPPAGKPPSKTLPWISGTFNVALMVAQYIGRQKRTERDLATTGYSPVGTAPFAAEPWYIRLGSFLRGDVMELAGDLGPLNVPVWRNHVRKVAGDKKPGETLSFGWQYKNPLEPFGLIEDVDVIYIKNNDGTWRVQSVADPPAGFVAPDLNRIIDTKVSDGEVVNMLSSTKGA